MIRSILIFVYIAAVLLVSGLAQASDLALVKSAQFDQKNYLMHIQGAFLSTCQDSPRPEIVQIVPTVENAEAVYIGVRTTKNPDVFCSQLVTGRYDLVFDVRTLGLPEHRNLVVKFRNAAHSAPALNVRIDKPGSNLDFAKVEIEGQLVEMPVVGFEEETHYAVISDDGKAVLVKSLVDLSTYGENRVRVTGIPLRHVIAPVLEPVAFEFKKKAGEQPELIFATEISLTPLQL